MVNEPPLRLRCACGWETSGTIDELVVAATDHGQRLHNMRPTRDEILAMVVAADDQASAERRPAAPGGHG
jgi:predicted small metal-binding protein